MSASERRKGVGGEREVAAVLREHGLTVRGLESSGDWLAIAGGVTLHVECKRQEIARVWLWQEQAELEAPPGTVPVVAFRRSRGRWWAMVPLDHLAGLVGGYAE